MREPDRNQPTLTLHYHWSVDFVASSLGVKRCDCDKTEDHVEVGTWKAKKCETKILRYFFDHFLKIEYKRFVFDTDLIRGLLSPVG